MKHLNVMGWAIVFLLASMATDQAAEKLRLGLVLPDLSNALNADMNRGARERAKELGNVEILTSSSFSGEEQADGMESYVAQHIDVIAYNSIDAAAVGPAIVKANAAGIPVIAINSAASGGKNATFMSPDQTESGRVIGRWLVGKLGKDGKVALVEGNPSDAGAAAVVTGLKEALASGGITKPVADSSTDWDRQRALAVATDILTAHPDLQAMYGANDDVAMGALQAIKAAGRKQGILLTGQNGTCEALTAMLGGDLDFTVMQFPKLVGRMNVDVALKLKAGEQVPEYIKVPTFGIDAATARAVAGGDASGIPADLAADVKARVLAAKNGCK